jgi:heavy metal sensor kinase
MPAEVTIPFLQSIRIRLLVLVVGLLAVVTGSLTLYILRQFEAATTFELEQEGILLSNALEASITPLVAAGDIAGLQQQIDRLVATRPRNDIEINIMLLQGESSAIVASNIPDNLEATSAEEHAHLLAALAGQRPVILIGRDESEAGPDADIRETGPPASPFHPDYYLAEAQRSLSLTTPLSVGERQLGSINLKLSLARIDQQLATIRWTLLLAQTIAFGVLVGGLVLLLTSQIFAPLRGMVRKMQGVAGGDLSQRINHPESSSEIGWLAHAFDRMIERLQATFNREHRFAADIAHELRTPLTALKGRIGVTLSQPRSVSEYQQTLQSLEKEVDRLSRLSHDLLFLARLEQGQLRPQRVAQDLSDLLGAIVEQMLPLAETKAVRLIEQVAPDLSLNGDADYLIRLFINLIDNAIKFTPSGGTVVIRAAATERNLAITISDSGPGIPPEHLPYLFDYFYRVEADRGRASGGSGLGLAIAAEIVRAHGGEIRVSSQVGAGTTFTVHLARC